MSDISSTILPETADDAAPIERLHERTFGPGRYRQDRLPYPRGRRRTGRPCRSRRASARCWWARCGSRDPYRRNKALLLGPLTVEPAFRERGIGQALIARALEEAKEQGPPARRAGRR